MIIVDDKIQNEVKNLVSYSSVSILSLNLDETGSLIEQIKKYPKKFSEISIYKTNMIQHAPSTHKFKIKSVKNMKSC